MRLGRAAAAALGLDADEAAGEGWDPRAHATARVVEKGAAFPPRPSLPPTLVCALCLWAACALAFFSAEGLDIAHCLALGAAGLALALLAVLLLWRGRAALIGAALLGAALGLALGMGGAAEQHADAQRAEGQSGSWTFEAVDDAASGTYGYSVCARTRLSDGESVQVVLLLDEELDPPRYGEVFVAAATLSPLSEASASYRWRQGVVAQANVYDIEEREREDLLGAVLSLRDEAIDLISAQGGGAGPAILAALVCGWRDELYDLDVYQDFQVCGLAHLVAVSGAHLSIASSFVAALISALRLPRPLSLLLQGLFILCYLVLAGMPISAVRAAAMAAAAMLSFIAKRRSAGVGALSLCIIGIIALDPAASLSISFALSALSSLGISLFNGLCAAWLRSALPRLPRSISDAVSLTFSSNILTTLLSAALFAQIPLVAPLANALVSPIFPIVCAGGLAAVAAALLLPALASPLLGAAALGARGLAALVSLLARIPYASIPASLSVPLALVLSAAAAIALWRIWPRPQPRVLAGLSAAAALGLSALIVVAPLTTGTRIVMLDVGQGDAFLLRSGGASVLIDTGTQDTMLKSALARQGVTHLDAVVISHSDDDHMGSLSSLSGIVQVDRVLLAQDALDCDCESCAELREAAASLVGEEQVEGLSLGDELQFGAFELEVVWPEAYEDEGGNADSLCLLASADVDRDEATDWTALFVGDAEQEQLSELLESGAVGQVDIYKVGHHGSKNALDEEIAQQLSPSLALVSVGEDNSYGHPAEETIAALEAAGAEVLRSDEAGDVSCKLGAESIVVSTQE